VGDHGHLPDGLTLGSHGDDTLIAGRIAHRDGDLTAHDDVHLLAGLTLHGDRVAVLVGMFGRDRRDGLQVLRRQRCEQWDVAQEQHPFHRRQGRHRSGHGSS
jgi:hypothetical protein